MRQMHGRAGFDLLRHRILIPSKRSVTTDYGTEPIAGTDPPSGTPTKETAQGRSYYVTSPTPQPSTSADRLDPP